jgi:hypothetical protein
VLDELELLGAVIAFISSGDVSLFLFLLLLEVVGVGTVGLLPRYYPAFSAGLFALLCGG